MAEFACGECDVCEPTPCGECRACKSKAPARCEEVKSARSKQCLKRDELKAAHEAEQADSASARRRKRAKNMSADTRAKKQYEPPEPRRRAGSAGSKAREAKKAKKKGGGPKAERTFNSHEHAFSKIGTLLALLAAAVTNGAKMVWPKEPRDIDGLEGRPGLDASWADSMGADFVIGVSPLPDWFEWAGDYENCEKTKDWLDRFLEICKEYDIRPYQPHWGLSPSKWMKLVGHYKSKKAMRKLREFAGECREAARLAVEGRALPAGCELCRKIAAAAAKISKGDLVKFRGALAQALGDDGEEEEAEDEEEEGAEPATVTVMEDGEPVTLFLDHVEFTPIFRGYFCGFCNGLLVPLFDIMPYDQIPGFLGRVHQMSRTTAGGFARAPAPAAAADSYKCLCREALGL